MSRLQKFLEQQPKANVLRILVIHQAPPKNIKNFKQNQN